LFDVGGSGGDSVEGLGQERGEVVVGGACGNSAGPASRLPERTRASGRGAGTSDFQGEVQPKARERDTSVLRLASPLAGFRGYAGRGMEEADGRFHLVAMLAARPGATQSLNAALVQELFRPKSGGVEMALAHDGERWNVF